MRILKNRFFVTLALAGSMISAHVYAQTSAWTIDPAHSSVNFEIVHMGVSHVHGSFGNVTGIVTLNDKEITRSTVTAKIDTTTVSTGVEARDTHLKSADFFDVKTNPAMTFKSTAVTRTGAKLQLVGDLTINGVTKPVTLDLDGPAPAQTAQGKTISGFSASGTISRKDFNFGQKFSAPILGDVVKFSVDVEIDKN